METGTVQAPPLGEGVEILPSPCTSPCGDVYLESQQLAKEPKWCLPSSFFAQHLQDCRDCILKHATDVEAVEEQYFGPNYKSWFDYCNSPAVESQSLHTNETVGGTGANGTETSSSQTLDTPLSTAPPGSKGETIQTRPSRSLSTPALVTVIVVPIVGVLVLLGITVYLIRKRRKNTTPDENWSKPQLHGDSLHVKPNMPPSELPDSEPHELSSTEVRELPTFANSAELQEKPESPWYELDTGVDWKEDMIKDEKWSEKSEKRE
ncbi:hypothetical protein QBC41DRAFT_297544 [Cercophora samala]|uniref:Uncharacterized protein n=1 Tax=Cercophora samala TaxID=330535 RepID=A0AA40DH91_9PEZI|nr:hypothetical protein QBC41DRAFT_297544 [Cercophora samala]